MCIHDGVHISGLFCYLAWLPVPGTQMLRNRVVSLVGTGLTVEKEWSKRCRIKTISRQSSPVLVARPTSSRWRTAPRDCALNSMYDMKQLYRVIHSIPEEMKVPFQMFVAGFKYREIAEKLGLPMGTVKSRLFFIRKRLKEELKDFSSWCAFLIEWCVLRSKWWAFLSEYDADGEALFYCQSSISCTLCLAFWTVTCAVWAASIAFSFTVVVWKGLFIESFHFFLVILSF